MSQYLFVVKVEVSHRMAAPEPLLKTTCQSGLYVPDAKYTQTVPKGGNEEGGPYTTKGKENNQNKYGKKKKKRRKERQGGGSEVDFLLLYYVPVFLAWSIETGAFSCAPLVIKENSRTGSGLVRASKSQGRTLW
ncbi:hypothetical protein CEXT_627811 [Caerostris extrusa]|uniref:Uncharacterized protein n=1 Tax=Caerostris extrusa TaxID=172846 RepID=A0AAV4XE69_CAEEX|nr:hypothetical protein CEXT_627811 [Caerostris extrusa]